MKKYPGPLNFFYDPAIIMIGLTAIAAFLVLNGTIDLKKYGLDKTISIENDGGGNGDHFPRIAGVDTGNLFAEIKPEIMENVYNTQEEATSTVPVKNGPVPLLGEKIIKPVPQFVVIAFDGSADPAMWEKTRTFARDELARGVSMKFTYFVSGVYFLSNANRDKYLAPGNIAGHSNIGFGGGKADIIQRVAEMNAAHNEGHEIGSHLNGHFDGSRWTYDDWRQELASFSDLVFNAAHNNGIDPAQCSLDFTADKIVGLRAPYLAKNSKLITALDDAGYRYDASSVSRPDAWPVKFKNVWEMPLAYAKLHGTDRRLIIMDYNFYYLQSEARDTAVKGSEEWKNIYDQTLNTYLDYFYANYKGNRAPVFIADHFENWNDGVYWEALKDFATTVCGREEVRCATYTQLADYLDSVSVESGSTKTTGAAAGDANGAF